MSPATPWLQDTRTLCIMELVYTTQFLIRVCFEVGKKMNQVYFEHVLMFYFPLHCAIGLQSTGVHCSPTPLCAHITSLNERFRI